MKFDAVLFDCDGVLVDSETITNGVLRQMLGELGWALDTLSCMRLFLGKALRDEVDVIARHTGKQIDQAWIEGFRLRRNAALLERLQPIDGIHAAVSAISSATGGRIACASGADMGKVRLQLGKVGLLPLFEGRLFSGIDCARSKPAPDVYLAAARALGVHPTRCAVVEDTPTGTQAGVAAGCTVFGFLAPHALPETADQLLAAGAVETFVTMQALPELLRLDA